MSLKIQTRISGISTEVAPGILLQGAVELTITEPLTFCELTLTLTGRGTSRIFRELSIAILPLQARWKAKVQICERNLVLVDQDTTLEPGEHSFPFRLLIPETIDFTPESLRKARRGSKAWKRVAPFIDVDTTHPLPPSVDVASEHGHIFLHGDASARIEYELSVTRKSHPREWKMAPSCAQKLKIAAPLGPPAQDVKWMDLMKALGGGYPGVSFSVLYPAAIAQWDVLPIQVAVLNGEGFSLVSLKVKLFTQFVVRGQTWVLSENSRAIVSEEKLLVWQGELGLTPGQYQTVQSKPLSASQVVTKFATLNIACTSHELEIKYKIQDANGRVVSGIWNRVAMEIQGPNRLMGGGGSESPQPSMGKAEYHKWSSDRSTAR